MSFIKTKRKRTKKDPITGKYIRIPSKDYTQEDILALLLNKGDYNEKSLSVHDLSIVS